MENDKLKFLKKIIILVLIIILLGIIAYLGYTKFIKKSISNEVESKSDIVEVDRSLNIELDDIIILIKDYYYKNNLVKEDNLINWTINKSTYIGYISENKSLKYYLIEGEYSCKDKGNTCVYLAVTDEPKEKNEFKIYALIDESQEEKKLESINQTINTNDTFIKTDVSVPSADASFNKVSSALKDFYSKNNFIDNGNLNEWNIKNIQYIKKENNLTYYQATGTYSCKDNSSECLYFEQVEDPVNNNYSFNIIIVIKEENGKIQVENIENNIYYQEGNTNNPNNITEQNKESNITKENLIKELKQYVKNKGLLTEDAIITWDITEVTYIGYYKENQSVRTYKFEGTYSCKDGESDCLYLEVADDEVKNGVYSYLIHADFDVTNNTLSINQIYGGLFVSDNFIFVNEKAK